MHATITPGKKPKQASRNLTQEIEDTQFLNLIRDMLEAGYVEDWQYHKTYSGTPQGGIVSPILANIYLHEFDEFMEKALVPCDVRPSQAVVLDDPTV